ncbi:MAG: hypothetical protein ACLP6G_03505 [Terriglobales bacterium]
MKIWGLTLFLCTLGLPAMAQQEQPAATAAPIEKSTPAVASSQHPEESIPPVAGESKVSESPKLDLTPDAEGKLTPEQMQKLTRVVAQNFQENYKKERDYTFIERDVDKTVDGAGLTKSTEIRTYEVINIYGEQVWRMIEKDDKPVDAKEAAKEEEKIQKIVDQHKAESEEDRKKQEEEKEAKRKEDSRKFVSAIVDSHDFKLVGTELADGWEAWVVDGEPRPSVALHDKEEKFVAKFRGRLWIDKESMQLAKVDLEAIDTASVGWVLARIHKGTRMTFERTRMDDQIWLPKHMSYKLDARVALFKGYNIEGDHTYRDYRKFRTSARIVGMGEVHEDK